MSVIPPFILTQSGLGCSRPKRGNRQSFEHDSLLVTSRRNNDHVAPRLQELELTCNSKNDTLNHAYRHPGLSARFNHSSATRELVAVTVLNNEPKLMLSVRFRPRNKNTNAQTKGKRLWVLLRVNKAPTGSDNRELSACRLREVTKNCEVDTDTLTRKPLTGSASGRPLFGWHTCTILLMLRSVLQGLEDSAAHQMRGLLRLGLQSVCRQAPKHRNRRVSEPVPYLFCWRRRPDSNR
jgi:hypothetical protein